MTVTILRPNVREKEEREREREATSVAAVWTNRTARARSRWLRQIELPAHVAAGWTNRTARARRSWLDSKRPH